MRPLITRDNTWIWATAVSALILAIRTVSIRDVFGPVVYLDEFVYWDNMIAIFHGKTKPISIYPPLYSIFMGLGLTGSDPYRLILLMNVLMGAVLPLLAWQFTNRLESSTRIFAVALAGLFPFLFIYPRMMMSENLFIPLFAAIHWILWIAAKRTGPVPLFITGLLLWLTCMTRYQGVFFVAAAAVAYLLSFYLCRKSAEDFPPRSLRLQIISAFLLVVIPLAGIILWIRFGIPGSWDMLGTAAKMYTQAAGHSTSRLLMWFSFYLSYGILGILPLLAPLLLISWKTITGRQDRRATITWLFFFIAAGVSTILAARHSAIIHYNLPNPAHLMGRYLIFMPIAGYFTLLSSQLFWKHLEAANRKIYLICLLASILLGVVAYQMIILGGIFKVPGSFIMSHVGIDAFIYRRHWVFVVLALTCGITILWPNRMLFLWAVSIFFAISSFLIRDKFFNTADGPEMFSSIIAQELEASDDTIIGTSHDGWFSENHARVYLRFKGIDSERILMGQGFDNPVVGAVVRTEPKSKRTVKGQFVSKSGLTVYLDKPEL